MEGCVVPVHGLPADPGVGAAKPFHMRPSPDQPALRCRAQQHPDSVRSGGVRMAVIVFVVSTTDQVALAAAHLAAAGPTIRVVPDAWGLDSLVEEEAPDILVTRWVLKHADVWQIWRAVDR